MPPVEARPWFWMRRTTLIVVVALITRIAVVIYLLSHTHLSWGVNEPGAIARAIVQGGGFSGAFHGATGPTAWLGPLYPALLACLFCFFGVETPAAAIAAIMLNVIFSSLTAAIMVQLGREHFGETAATIAGWAWALSPPLLFMPWLLWETCLSGLVLIFALKTTLRLCDLSRSAEWASCGAIWSVAALLNPALLAPLAALALETVVHTRRWKGPALMVLVCALGLLPWTARNFLAFGRFVPVRSNFWPEFYFGNVDFSPHPIGDSMLYQREGEILFANDLKTRALNFVSSNPKLFLRLTGERIFAFWMQPPQLQPYPILLLVFTVGGLVQARKQKQRWVGYASALLLYPIVYYITYAFARYRYPLEPLMYVLASYFVYSLFVRKTQIAPTTASTLLKSAV